MGDGSSLAELGHHLFGRRARLVVAAWVLGVDGGVFSQHDAVKETALTQSNVRQELERLVSFGMLDNIPRGDGPGRRYYARTEHPAWSVVEAAVAAADKMTGDTLVRRSDT